MIIIISPAKNLDFDSKYNFEVTKPRLLKFTHKLISNLKNKSIQDIEKLMSISTSLATLNAQRFHNFTNNPSSEQTQPAIFAFNGDVYQGLQASSFNAQKMEFAQKHLRILSGLYGILKPLDLIQPYRLEMGTKFSVGSDNNLYEFWKDKVTGFLNEELDEGELFINLASNEYFSSINSKLLNTNVISPQFKDFKNGKLKIISFYAKKARGMMADHIIRSGVTSPKDLQRFKTAGYRYSKQDSDESNLVFLRKEGAA